MAFCTGCGADVSGRNFCVYGSAPQQQMMPPKKTSPVVWIVLGIVGFFVLIAIVVTVGIGLFVHKVKQNPALAMAKLLTAANPNVEVVGSDSGNNTVTFRDKQTGETITMNFDQIKQGRIDFRGPKGEHASINAHGSGDSGTLEINGPNGSMKFGSGTAAQIPSWVPSYPGATPTGNFSMQGADGANGSFGFTTSDDTKHVLDFYQQALSAAGFKITNNMTSNTPTGSGGMVAAENESTKQTVVASVSQEGGGTKVGVIYGTKK